MVSYNIYRSQELVYPILREISRSWYNKELGPTSGVNTTMELTEKLGKNKQHISNALNELKDRGIVRSEPEGRKKIYEIDYEGFFQDWNNRLLTEKEKPDAKPFEDNREAAKIFRWYAINYFQLNESSTLEDMLLGHFLYKLLRLERTGTIKEMIEVISYSMYPDTNFNFPDDHEKY